MKFDGTLGIRYTYNGKEFKEIINPLYAGLDQDLSENGNDVWSYGLNGDGNEDDRRTLFGSYNDDDSLSTDGILTIKILDFWDGEERWIDDIDIISAEDCYDYEEVNDKLSDYFNSRDADLITRALADLSINKYQLLKGILQIVENRQKGNNDDFIPDVFKNV